MTKQEFDSTYSIYKLADSLANFSANQVKKSLKTFLCARNVDVQDFLHNKAITFERNLRSCTYLYVSNADKSVVAYITLGIKSLLTNDLSDETIKFLDGYTSQMPSIPCYLIAQLGKSDTCKEKIGKFLLDDALSIIDKSQDSLKGRFVLIDSVNDDKVINFYKQNSFIALENDKSLKSIKMIKPYFECSELKI